MASVPSFLNYNRSISPSEAFMYAIDEQGGKHPVEVVERTVRGAISNYIEKHVSSSPTDATASKKFKLEAPNPQTVDVAFLPPHATGLCVEFSIVIESASIAPASCNDPKVKSALTSLAEAYGQKGGYHFLAKRYLWNIANARPLWRNRIALNKKVDIEYNGRNVRFLADTIPLDRYPGDGQFPTEFHQLAEVMGDALSGRTPPLFLKVSISGDLPPGAEVYPSQEFIQDEEQLKVKGSDKAKKGRVLSSIRLSSGARQATIHSQKIGNALRTVDEWHSQVDIHGAIPAEVYGYLHSYQTAVRSEGGETNLYKMILQVDALGKELESNPVVDNNSFGDIHYLFATLIRGGVFSKSNS